ncbi:TIGR04282 family arsenosugar biosynthesis glycosyltransferase [Flavobacterium sp. F-328]|jgi:rSAM/selenodomain-associated transferase 1|uniref:TIGR04282 family arsenosugar biosynthesis glycosyltransferase n=1 Tax=Flavobacterium erciyesense TaxID=2825842 RepID=A0ABS5D2W1_9FLAO|nr:TIGR04282 family arsenosugar biosynthesis glycosyltransferase [Flavobacterium erciyesense]MBQ0908367.1 TIGR04282 family arsenosugar biosynthesis glycosyltransferase [Flavobacterium erciyesense]
MQQKNAIILFTKNPELGKVKTRLAKTIGNEKALEIYKKLLHHTQTIVTPVAADKFLFYSDAIVRKDQWPETEFHKKVQHGSDLGERMKTAFQEVFSLGYTSVCIIGSDCYELTSTIIDDAFTQLETYDTVIGPTFDGGYYLLGMKKLHGFVFLNKTWSTETVYPDTIAGIQENSLTYFDLPKLTDIDEEKDLPLIWK